MALNAFGAMLLALLALPAIVEFVQAAVLSADAAPAAAQRSTKAKRGATAADGAAAGSGDALRQAVLVAGLVRAAAAFCAALSAAIQRRHLYVWALFAPRFAFEACFLVLTDLALLLVAALS